MVMIDIHQAQKQLVELIDRVIAGEELIIAKNDQPLAKVTAIKKIRKPRHFGSAQGLIIIADDFDAPLEELEDYM